MAYKDGDISVDEHFARFGKKSYAINKINSVEVRETVKKGSQAYVLWWLLMALFFFSAYGSAPVAQESAATFALIGAFFAFIGWRSFSKRHPTPLYHLYLMTSSSEAQALTTTDESVIDKLRNEIEWAMTGH
ncbi:hypothetical protein E5554_15915 [Sphingobium sp. PAMC28499]|uniref:DUF6232 family protein n=1 Tax=Sphingobium sp. PAMC28499 TaxID=2565554 RepID=UPI00109D9394|nr:DUF6232 family protein [Sphingobium sp. PAMC28499]QCB39179.1 hypothetical protein E5554_15915 [Sphingobium sp. PAMC28499]|tara:strand:- start:5227 stop:5622 length:396 start_codon:yes stop_codon:yes gene_type:complete